MTSPSPSSSANVLTVSSRGRTRIPNPPALPWVVYDGECGFCKLWIARWHRRLRDRVFFAPFQEAASLYPTLPLDRFARAVQRLNPDGTVTEAAEAVFETLAMQPGGGLWLWLYRTAPGMAVATEALYGWVARHRAPLYPTTRWLLGPPQAVAERPARRCLPWALGAVALGVTGALLWRRRRRPC